MPVVEESVVIARPPEEVFDYLAQADNLPVWDSSIVQAEQVGTGPVGVGTRWRGASKILGRRFRVDHRAHRVRPATAQQQPLDRRQAAVHRDALAGAGRRRHPLHLPGGRRLRPGWSLRPTRRPLCGKSASPHGPGQPRDPRRAAREGFTSLNRPKPKPPRRRRAARVAASAPSPTTHTHRPRAVRRLSASEQDLRHRRGAEPRSRRSNGGHDATAVDIRTCRWARRRAHAVLPVGYDGSAGL
jgi:hypothetical protein